MGKQVSVDSFIAGLNHPLSKEIQALRSIIGSASAELMEGIKWNAPSYALAGNDIITFNFRYPEYVAIIFHTGPKGKDSQTGQPLFVDGSGRIEWLADKRAMVKFNSLNQIESSRDWLVGLVRQWTTFAQQGFAPATRLDS